MAKSKCFGWIAVTMLVATGTAFSTEMAAAQLELDFSGSTYEVQSPDTFRIRRLTVVGQPGVYWVDLHWTGRELVSLESGVDTEASPCSLVRCQPGTHCVPISDVAICAQDQANRCEVTCPKVGGVTATLNGTCADYANQIKNHGCDCVE